MNKRTYIQERLFELQDEKNAAFQAKLTPGIAEESFIGVRVPAARKLAKELIKEGVYEEFLKELPHAYYDENILHSLLLSEIKDYDTCIREIESFLPFVDNWAVCDILSPKIFKKHKEEVMQEIRKWSASDETYTCRFGLEMLMSFFLDADFKPEYLEIAVAARSEEYYVMMMVAWFFATALAKQWDATIPYLLDNVLSEWVHNKTIQKACESRRITDEQKNYLRTLKIKKKK